METEIVSIVVTGVVCLIIGTAGGLLLGFWCAIDAIDNEDLVIKRNDKRGKE